MLGSVYTGRVNVFNKIWVCLVTGAWLRGATRASSLPMLTRRSRDFGVTPSTSLAREEPRQTPETSKWLKESGMISTVASHRPFSPTAPTQAGVVVGCGLPPSGSSEIASAAAFAIGALLSVMNRTRPSLSGRNTPALAGLPCFGTTHSWRVRPARGGREPAAGKDQAFRLAPIGTQLRLFGSARGQPDRPRILRHQHS